MKLPALAVIGALSGMAALMGMANAMPLAPNVAVQSAPGIVLVWGGCGPGWRPAWHGCVPDPRWKGRRPPRWGSRRWRRGW